MVFFKGIFTTSDFTQNIYNLMAIIGFILSGYLTIKSYLKSKINITMKVLDYREYMRNLQFIVYLQNNSSMPICISSIMLDITPFCSDKPKEPDEHCYSSCVLLPKKLEGTKGKILVNSSFPVNLVGWEGRILILEFPSHCRANQYHCGDENFTVFTNRGTVNINTFVCESQKYFSNQYTNFYK